MQKLLLASLAALCASPIAAQPPAAVLAWNSGATDAPALTVKSLSPGFWIIRQSKQSNFEAPFMYLIAGTKQALLVDTGAEPAAGTTLPLENVVDSLLKDRARALQVPRFPLVVIHSHGHRDHKFQDSVFIARPATTFIGPNVDAVRNYFRLATWPEGEGTIELGDRRVTVIPLPGHEPAHLGIYDATARAMLTGDMLYPGLLTIRDWPAYQASAERLERFAAGHAIAYVLGAHVEMTDQPRVMYPLGSRSQPREHMLGLTPAAITELARTTATLGDFRENDVHNDFILARVPTPARPSPR